MKLLLVALTWLSVSQPNSLDTKGIESYMRFPGMEDVEVVWKDCGQDNAFWDRRRTVIMCNELRDNPEGMQRFYLAHEFAHAIIDRLNIPVTGSEEVAADELAALVLLTLDMDDDVQAMEVEWITHAQPYLNPSDTHGHDLQRAAAVGCLRLGKRGWPLDRCDLKWRNTVLTWSRLLAKSHYEL